MCMGNVHLHSTKRYLVLKVLTKLMTIPDKIVCGMTLNFFVIFIQVAILHCRILVQEKASTML